MKLSKYIKQIDITKSQLKPAITAINKYVSTRISGLSQNSKPFISSILSNELSNKKLFIVAPSITIALKYQQQLSEYTDKEVYFLPAQEVSPYEMTYSDINTHSEQIRILERFANSKDVIICTYPKALTNTLLDYRKAGNFSIPLKKGVEIDTQQLAKKLVGLGYKRVTSVTDIGEFSLRGDILDIYPISDNPARIEFWGDEVDKIRYFSIENQRSTSKADFVKILPLYKIVQSPENSDIIRNYLNTKTPKNEIEEELFSKTYDFLENNEYFEGIEVFSSIVDDLISSPTDFLDSDSVLVFDESFNCYQKLFTIDEAYNKEYERFSTEGLLFELPQMLHYQPFELNKKTNDIKKVQFDSFIDDVDMPTFEIECVSPKSFSNNIENMILFVDEYRKKSFNCVIFSDYNSQTKEYLDFSEIPSIDLEELSASDKNQVTLSNAPISGGFVLPDLEIFSITDIEIFNKIEKKPTITKKLAKKENIDYILSINDLKYGDFVVHIKHGVGKFIGLTKQTLDEQVKDYISIEYKSGDKLHIPAEQINFLTKYRGSSDSPPSLSKMGGADWDKVKSKIKKDILEVAQNLLNLYARRAKVKGHKFDSDSVWQVEMEDAFPYTETPDQLKAINDTKADMETDKPMDRLICGDVGFGKTEVAIRAAFKAALSGKQVVILAPTTILAQQHYSTFKDRFAPYPLKVGLLSRFKSPKEIKKTISDIALGECDIIIGTHRVLQKDVIYKNLGLLIIDEEHRFGVSHKEKIKELRSDVDVITMSATPIPRTLYMSLSGARDMSLINTPPVNRSPVKTYIGEFSNSIVRTAIKHELDRDGQVFIVHNRVQSIHKFASNIAEIIPEAKICVAHGQMKESELEQIMYDFANKEYNVLISTTIIESGLDIPDANTMIIDHADKFGLAQLYQLRGRVGRSDKQAYAYLLFNKDQILSDDAQKRLEAIKEFSNLGGGYQIAMKDLEIRGIGHLLGEKQHGHMVEVGFDTYCSLLEDAISALKGEYVPEKVMTIVDINITAHIPDDYVGSTDQKIIEYKRLADVGSLRELELIQAEWEDRFGKIPTPATTLINIIKIRLLASDCGVSDIIETPNGIKISSNLTYEAWMKIKPNIPPKIQSKIKFSLNNSKDKKTNSYLILNNSSLSNNQLLNILEDLFYYIKNVSK